MTWEEQHPHGTSLLGRENEFNRRTFGEEGMGHVDVDPNVCTENNECPHYHYLDDKDSPDNIPIHMLIAAYRDRLCPRTLHYAFMHASNPKRLFIRVLQQRMPDSNLDDDADCWEAYCANYNPKCEEQYRSNVQIVNVDARQAKGPTDARSKLSAMIEHDYRAGNNSPLLHAVQPTDFCMQTDSHMDFSDDFDNGLIAMFHRCENDYAVLSTYVTDIAHNNEPDLKVVPNLCMVEFRNSIRNWGTKECNGLKKPKMTNAMWGAGLSFHRCHAELIVPIDPYLDNVFDGEEGSRGIRLWTHGYDVYTPDRVLVTHDYEGHQTNPVVHSWGKRLQKQAENITFDSSWPWLREIEQAQKTVKIFGTPRVNLLLGIPDRVPAAKFGQFDVVETMTEEEMRERDMIRASKYGLGTKRKLDQVLDFTGIDLAARKMIKNRCGNLKWVPYDEDGAGDYGLGLAMARPLAGEGQQRQQPGIRAATPFLGTGGQPGMNTMVADGLLPAIVVLALLVFVRCRLSVRKLPILIGRRGKMA